MALTNNKKQYRPNEREPFIYEYIHTNWIECVPFKNVEIHILYELIMMEKITSN